jgi:FkbM family methyltransferase
MMPDIYLPILKGSLKGARWNLNAGGKILRLLLSTYEREQTKLFVDKVGTGHTVFDVGAHAGYYTLLASRLAGPNGAVHAFEPDENNVVHLRKHVEANNAANVTIVAKAVSEENGAAHFELGSGSGTGSLSESGSLTVETLSLDSYCRETGAKPDLMKIDVEGAEARVLRGAAGVLESARPTIVLSTHGPEVHGECCRLLTSHGYRLEPIGGGDIDESRELICSRRPEA